MTLVMKSCSDLCSTYETPTCGVTVEAGAIDLDLSVSYGSRDGAIIEECTGRCGPPVLAHCTLEPLQAGEYAVTSRNFSTTITVE